MKRTPTRLVALILSVVMLIGLLPVASFAAETLTSYTFNFRKLKWGQWSNEGYSPSYVTSFDMTTAGNSACLNDYEGVATAPWMFDSVGGGASVGWNSSSGSYGPYMNGSAGGYSAYRVRVATAGTYWLVPRYTVSTFGAKIKYYFAPASATNPRDNAYYVGTIDTKSATLVGDLETRLAAKTLSAGDYIVSFVFDTGASNAYYFTNAFLLNGVVDEYSFDADDVTVSEGAQVQQELGLLLNGTAISIATATGLSAISTDSTVATATLSSSADGARAYLSVFGHDKGTATIVITATANGKSVLKNLYVTVKSPSSNLVLAHNALESYTIEAGTTQVVNLSATYGGETIDLNNVSLVATADDETVIRGEIVKKADGTAIATFAGLKKGKTNVDISAYYEGNSTKISASFIVTSRTDEYKYDFLKLFYGPWSDNGYDPTTITEFSMTTEGSADEITPETPSAPWIFDSKDDGSTLAWTSSSAGRGPAWTTPVGGWVKYRIRLTESGIYTPKTTYTTYTTIGNVTYYLAPVDAINPTDDLYRLAVVNAYSATDNKDKSYSFRKLNLAAGDYILTLVMTGKNAAIHEAINPSFFLKNFILEKPTIGVFYGISDINESVAVGATKRFEIILARDGYEVEASRASKLTVRSAKAATAKAELVMSEDGKKAYVDVTGVAEGYTSVTLSATVDGRASTHSALVAVKPGDLLGKVTTNVSTQKLTAGATTGITVDAYTMDGTKLNNANLDIVFTSSDSTVASVSASGVVTAHNQGSAKITVKVSDGVSSVTLNPISFSVTGYSTLESAYISNVEQVPVGGTLKLRVGGTLKYGAAMPESMATATYTLVSASPAGAATLSNGVLTGVAAGSVTVRATVTFNGKTVTTPNRTITIRSGKTRSTFYTEEKRKNVAENASKYVWANNEVKMYTSLADAYVGKEEFLWNLITTQQLPRSIRVGYRYDPKHNICRYCGVDIVHLKGTNYAFTYNVDANPWKVQCPACTRYFPSNDFEKFYRSGINSSGNWSYEQAKKYGSAYLTNDLYPEMGAGWGVDDGYGYRTGKNFTASTESGKVTWEETHTYIAYYNHWALWNGYIPNVMTATALAYVYSGDPKYGRIAAIMVDRIADVYPLMDTGAYDPKFWNNGWYGGKTLGGIWECSNVSKVAKAYDAVFDLYDDPQVISFLSAKATKYYMANKKTTGNAIRQNIDDNYLRVAIDAITNGSRQIFGNFGFHQSAAVDAAVVLDTQPETTNTIEWVLNGVGAVNDTILTTVSRDGAGNETSPNYNFGWAGALYDIMETLGGYDQYSANLYTNPKVIKMLKMNFPLTLMRKATVQIGDSEGVDVHNLAMAPEPMIPAFLATNDKELGQMIYFLNGNKTTGLSGSIFTNTDDLSGKLQKIINTYGEYPFDKSMHLTDYGFAILRSGTLQGKDDTQRDIWMTHGITQGHGQRDKLNIGIDAFGLCLAPDMGYPSTTLATGDIVNWERSTIIHNTVQVNNIHSDSIFYSDQPLHFDDDGRVKVMDVRSPSAYPEITSEYRRSVVMVDVDEENSYYVDFFRVIGGRSHIYSFHALSDTVAETSGLNLVSRAGTYAGVNVPYGPGNVESGHDGLLKIMEDLNPSKNFSIDFLIKDFRSQATKDGEIHLRMTQLNEVQPDDVTTAQGRPPIINKNPEWLQFALVRRTGTNLDSLFTTVFEPYCDNRFVAKEEGVVMMRQSGAAYDGTDKARAVKITLANGRVDYIVYSTDNQIKWRVDNTFDFMGTFGVYTIENGVPTYAYICDGTQIGSHVTDGASYTGSITNFTRDIAFDNYINVTFNGDVDYDNLVGRFINVNNGSGYNACYEIKGVTPNGTNAARIYTGDVTFFRGDSKSYDIGVGMTFSIAKSKSFGVEAPSAGEVLTFNAVEDQVAAYNSPYSLQIRANSSSGGKIVYKMTSGPAGATFDSLTRTMSWTPTAFGNYSATFTATCNGKTETLTVPITVLAAPPVLITGAQIRLSGVQGLRYISKMSLENIKLLEASGATEIEYGTLLIPSADVRNYKDIQLGATLNGHAVAKVPAVFIYDITETENIYTAVITNVLEKNYSRAYTARPYLSYKDKDGTQHAVYGDSCVSRSIYQVAKAALNDADRYTDADLATLQGIVSVVEN